jgi:hypothetical protein
MNPIALVISFLDGTERTVEAVAADLIAFEDKFNLSVVRLEQEIRLTHLFFLAWHALKRQGQTEDDFNKWVESVSIVSQAEEKKSKG